MPTSVICRSGPDGVRAGRFGRSVRRRTDRAAGLPASASPAVPARGFTLLELIVVLLLMGLVTALAMPNLERLSAGVARKTERDRILDQFTGLGRRAMLQGRSYVVFGSDGAQDGDDPAGASFPAGHERHVIDLPQGWEVLLDPPLVFRANGVCLGAELTLRHRGVEDVRIDLEPPYCRIDADA